MCLHNGKKWSNVHVIVVDKKEMHTDVQVVGKDRTLTLRQSKNEKGRKEWELIDGTISDQGLDTIITSLNYYLTHICSI